MERLHMRREGLLRQNIWFRRDEQARPVWQDTFVYAILRDEWLAHAAEEELSGAEAKSGR